MRRFVDDIIAGRSLPPNCAQTLGARVLEGSDGHFKSEFEATEAFYNGAAVVQGGFLSAMLDDTMGPAIITTLADDETHSTVDLYIQFLRPATAGTLVCEAHVTHRGRTIRMAEGTLAKPDGTVIAIGRCSSIVKKMPAGGS